MQLFPLSTMSITSAYFRTKQQENRTKPTGEQLSSPPTNCIVTQQLENTVTALVCVSIQQQNQGEMSQFLQSWTKSVENFALSYQQNTYPTDLVPLWSLHSPHPGQSCLVGIRNDPARLQHCLSGGKGEYLSLPGLSRALSCN